MLQPCNQPNQNKITIEILSTNNISDILTSKGINVKYSNNEFYPLLTIVNINKEKLSEILSIKGILGTREINRKVVLDK